MMVLDFVLDFFDFVDCVLMCELVNICLCILLVIFYVI